MLTPQEFQERGLIMIVKAAVVGSYRRSYEGLMEKRNEIEALGVEILFPLKNSNRINPNDAFVILDTDKSLDVYDLQAKNLKLIEQCDFVYVYNPKGYIGASVILEVGYALKCHKKIISLETPTDQTLAAFIEPVTDIQNFVNTFRDMKDINSMQAFCRRFVEEKGFENESILETFLLWQEEIGELASAIRKSTGIKTNEESARKRDNLEHEMADCLKYLLILSNKLEIDLLKAFRNKQLIDVKRVWATELN